MHAVPAASSASSGTPVASSRAASPTEPPTSAVKMLGESRARRIVDRRQRKRTRLDAQQQLQGPWVVPTEKRRRAKAYDSMIILYDDPVRVTAVT